MKKMFMREAGLCVALIVGAIAMTSFVVGVHLAHADPKPGLWQESVTQADGVTVRKIRDTTGGDFNVCYVASRVALPGGSLSAPMTVSVAISCVPERKP